jgi:soluble lytic murein transglycosylase-like protein
MSIDYSKLTPTQLEIAWRIHGAAVKHGVSPDLALAQGMAESRLFDAGVNAKKATGVMQVKQDAADAVFKKLGIRLDPKNPEENIELGVLYMKVLGDRFGDDPEGIARAYNAGPTAYANDRAYSKETNDYVNRVRNYGGFATTATPPPTALNALVPNGTHLGYGDQSAYVSPLEEMSQSLK